MTKSITIQGLSFDVSAPYNEGHTLTEPEARALNQVRAENIRNNMARKVKDAKETHGETLPDNVIKELTDEVAEYDANYEFTLASTGGSTRTLNPVEREARAIARTALRAKLKQENRRVLKKDEEPEREGDVTKDAFDEAVEKIAEREDVVKAAQKAVAARDKLEVGDIAA